MPCFVGPHRLHKRPCTGIFLRKASQVPGQVLFDLTFGLGEEAEVPAIAKRPGNRADGEGTGVPDGIEQAGAAAKLGNALRAPRKMILFLARRALERLTRMGIAGCQRLPLIQRLGAHFADVVDAHQRGGMPAVVLAELRLRRSVAGRWPARVRDPAYRAQRPVDLRDELIEVRHAVRVAPAKKTGASRRPFEYC